jgi:glycosyltransferase involved in cell wall biosynthesis
MLDEMNSEIEMSDKTLRILHLATHTGINAGGAFEMLQMAIGLKERGHDVTCAFNWRDGRTGQGERNFAPVEAAGVPFTTFRMESFLSRALGDRRRFRQFVQQHEFDLIHCHRPRALRFALETLDAEKCPALVTHRGNSNELDDNARRLYGNPRIGAIICVAEELRQIAIRGGLNGDKVVTNYTGVDERLFCPDVDGQAARRELGIPLEAPVVGLLANFDGKKAHDQFLQGATLVARALPNVRFLLVGRGVTDEFRAQLRALDLQEKTVLAGFRNDAPRMIAAMDVSINVSTSGEGLTGAMRESLAMKKPVVCTDIGGNRELVRDGETGYLIPPAQPQEFANRVLDLLRDRDKARRFGQNGYNLVMQLFTREKSLERLEAIYHAVLSDEKLPAAE